MLLLFSKRFCFLTMCNCIQTVLMMGWKNKRRPRTYDKKRSVVLFLCECDFHRVTRANLKSLKRIFCGSRLEIIFELNESNIVSTWDKTNFFKSWILNKQHLDELFACFFRKVREEKNWIRGLFHESWMRDSSLGSRSASLVFTFLTSGFIWSRDLLSLLERALFLCNDIRISFREGNPLEERELNNK